MGKSGAIRAGQAFVELFADKGPLIKTLKSAEGTLKSWGGKVAGIGAGITAGAGAVAAPIVAAVASFVNLGGAMDDAGQRTSLGAAAFSELAYAAELGGASAEDLEGGFRKLSQLVGATGTAAAASSAKLNDLGLNLKTLKGLSPEKQFDAIADKLAGIKDPTAQAVAAMDVFGKSGTKLLPMLRDGSDGIGKLRERARELGISFSDEGAGAAAKLGDVLSDLWKTVQGIGNAIGSALAPELTALASGATNVVATVSKWVRENKDLVVSAARMVAIVGAAGAGLVALGSVISLGGVALGGLASVVGVVGSVLATVVSPIGLVTAAVVGLGAVFPQVRTKAGEVFDWLKGVWSELVGDATAAWQGISDALAGGDLALAANVAWLAIKVEFQKGIGFLSGIWLEWKGFFLDVWDAAIAGAATTLVNGWAAIETAWVESIGVLSDAWTMFTSGMQSTWATVQGKIAEGFAWLIAKMQGLDPAEVIAEVRSQTQGRLNEISGQQDKTISSREVERKKRLAGIESMRSGSASVIQSDLRSQQAERQRSTQAGLDASAAELAKAKSERDAAFRAAALARAEAGKKRKVGGGKEQVDDALAQAGEAAKGTTTGAFSGQNLEGLGGGRVADRTMKATEATAKGVAKLKDELRNNKPTWRR